MEKNMGRENFSMMVTIMCLALATTGMLLSGKRAIAAESSEAHPPNIVYILCDDLGYGDVHCLNPERGKIPTPNIDGLRKEGMAFLDCHGSSSVCTPSRYSILTGRYNWRTQLQHGVLEGDSLPLIAPERLTVAGLLKQHGYETAIIGKWHLGLQFGQTNSLPKGKELQLWVDSPACKNYYSQPITDGPLQHGFDYFFGISGSLDMPPFDYIENDHFTEIPTMVKKFVRSGPAAADFEPVGVLPKLTSKAAEYIEKEKANKKPFFLYLALPSPHTPLVPSKEWQGKSPLGAYGDYVMETDWAIGEVLKAIDQAGLRDNTLVMLTSDNGCAPYIGVAKLEAQGHYPSAQFRGYKADIWDGGHRIPFLARWPGKIKPDSQSDQIVCLGDLLATCASLVDTKLPDRAGEDSVSILPALLGTDKAPLREAIVSHSMYGRFAIRQGNWKLELCPGSGGWSQPKDPAALKAGLPHLQLYNMHDDVGEQVNLEAKNLEVVTNLMKLLEKYVNDGRSTPGAPQTNDVIVDVWKKNLDEPTLKNGAPVKGD